jgi:hypothetical protein
MGGPDSSVARLGTVLVYLPLLIVGYLLVLVALMRGIAMVLGWGVTLPLFGVLHLAISFLGMARGRRLGAVERYDVLDPTVAPPATPPQQPVYNNRPVLPPPFSGPHSARAVGGTPLLNTFFDSSGRLR